MAILNTLHFFQFQLKMKFCILIFLISTKDCYCNRQPILVSGIGRIGGGESEPSNIGNSEGFLSSTNFNNFLDTINTRNNNYKEDSCLGNFEINEGIIIRTHDSQALGGKYLNESDLGINIKSREECLRLCCQTPNCNVITYEEKDSGSCYMFDCGPLEKLRCKFTQQEHYMSAILKQRIEPPTTSRNTQHENELNELRNVESFKNKGNVLNNNHNSGNPTHAITNNDQRSHSIVSVGGSSSSGTVTNGGHEQVAGSVVGALQSMPPVAAASQSQPLLLQQQYMNDGITTDNNKNTSPAARCNRVQFECKASKDCIAIYNVCDGIPQCSDGSDEAAELHCHGGSSSDVKQQSKEHNNGPSPNLASSSTSGNSFVGDSSLVLANNNNHRGGVGPPQQQLSQAAEDFRIFQLQQQQQPITRSGLENHRIFNHKDAGVLDEAYGIQQQQQHSIPQQGFQPSNSWKSYDYNNPDIVNPYYRNPSSYGGMNTNNNYGISSPYLPLPYPPNYINNNNNGQQFNSVPLQQSHLQQPQLYNNNMQGSLEDQSQQLQQQQQQQQPYLNANPLYSNVNGMPQTPQHLAIATHSTQQQIIKSTHSPLTIPTTIKSSIITTKKITNPDTSSGQSSHHNDDHNHDHSSADHKHNSEENKLVQSLLQRTSLALSDTKMEIDKDAIENVPGFGAIFAFIIGIAMSLLMVIILGCRFRHRKSGVRRRGKNRLDPDYLVDGMYL